MTKCERAQQLRDTGLSWREVGEAMGCTAKQAEGRAFYWRTRDQPRRKELAAAWHEANRERINAGERVRYNVNHAAHLDRFARYRGKNREKCRVYAAQYRAEHLEASRARGREYRSKINYGPEWGPVHHALMNLKRAIKGKEPTNE
jgi:hypothetical protein